MFYSVYFPKRMAVFPGTRRRINAFLESKHKTDSILASAEIDLDYLLKTTQRDQHSGTINDQNHVLDNGTLKSPVHHFQRNIALVSRNTKVRNDLNSKILPHCFDKTKKSDLKFLPTSSYNFQDRWNAQCTQHYKVFETLHENHVHTCRVYCFQTF